MWVSESLVMGGRHEAESQCDPECGPGECDVRLVIRSEWMLGVNVNVNRLVYRVGGNFIKSQPPESGFHEISQLYAGIWWAAYLPATVDWVQ